MATNKKFDYRIIQNNTTWTTEIVRRVTARKSMVSKSQGDFATEAEAKEWGEKELQIFLKNLTERNKIRSEKRK